MGIGPAVRAATPQKAPQAVVFSHPNHELSVYGYLARERPRLVYLTDGGGEGRVAQTREGLAAIGCLDRAVFLGHTEGSLYDAFLENDVPFWRRLVAQVREVLDDEKPARVLCDAVELYNPVHDASLPVVIAALDGATRVDVLEVPLVWQRPGPGETYAVQTVHPARGPGVVLARLRPDEVARKAHARDAIYTMLRDQMGGLLTAVPSQTLANEVAMPWQGGLVGPGGDIALRYEWRGELLRSRGEVERVLRYADHWLPVVREMTEGDCG